MDTGSLRLFALSESRPFGERVAASLGVALSRHEEREFEDGEHKTRPLENVRGTDVYVVQSLYAGPEGSVNDKLCRLLFFIGALKDASARRVTAVMPYLCYARKDRRSQPRDPVTTRYVAQVLEAVGADGVVTLDVHNLAAFENAFRCTKDHLEARTLFADFLLPRIAGGQAVVVSPDAGGVKRAEALRLTLSRRMGREAGIAFLEKHRSDGVVSGDAVIGDVHGKVALIVDDLIASGGTLARAARACRERGASTVYALATHALFVGDAIRVLGTADIEHLVITDAVPPVNLEREGGERLQRKVTVLETAPLFAEAIRRLHGGGSIVNLLEE
jgi:ribose-phosphate pyrophosphokinase